MIQTQEAATRGIGYIPALDGIRAWAVLSVMISHSSIMTTPFQYIGGVVGVDIFFVLSGFLITSLLMGEKQATGRVRVGAFYARRGLRLLPALFVMIPVGALSAWWFGSNLSGRSYPIAALMSLTYLGNWFQALTPDLGLLGHVWSLGIEEQYYIIWPTVLILMFSRWSSARRLAVLVALMAIGSGLLRAIVYAEIGHVQAYFWTFTHLGGILTGSALGLLLFDPPKWIAFVRRPIVVTAAVVVAIAASIPVRPETRWYYTGLGVVIEVAVAVVIAHVALNGRSWVTSVLSLRPVRGIGRISYGVYLFHPLLMWPLWKAVPRWAWVPAAFAAGAGSIAFAALSYNLIERRALRLKKRFEPERTGLTGRPGSAQPA